MARHYALCGTLKKLEFLSESKSPLLGRKNTFSTGSVALSGPKGIPCTAQASHPDSWGPFSDWLMTLLCDQRHLAVTTPCLSLPTASSIMLFTSLRVNLHSETLSSAHNAQKKLEGRGPHSRKSRLLLHHSIACTGHSKDRDH